MSETPKTLAAAAAVLLAVSIAGTATERTETDHHAPAVAAPAETGRGPVSRTTGQSATPTGPATPGH